MIAIAAELEAVRTPRAKLVEPSDKCTCKCCQQDPPTLCARKLTLTPKDAADARRVLAVAGPLAGTRLVRWAPSSQYTSAKDRPEPMGEVACRVCRRPIAVFAYIATLLKSHHLSIECEACR